MERGGSAGFLPPFPHFATQAIHAGQEPEQWRSAAVVPPISLSTTFKQQAPGQHAVSAAGAPVRPYPGDSGGGGRQRGVRPGPARRAPGGRQALEGEGTPALPHVEIFSLVLPPAKNPKHLFSSRSGGLHAAGAFLEDRVITKLYFAAGPGQNTLSHLYVLCKRLL